MKRNLTPLLSIGALVLGLWGLPSCGGEKPSGAGEPAPQNQSTPEDSAKESPEAPAEAPRQDGALSEGDLAPPVQLKNQRGEEIDLSSVLKENAVVLYFYPKDDTPGCTLEAKDFRDRLPEIEALGAKVFGVSLDSVDSHAAFAEKFELNFDILADTDHSVSRAYGVLGMYETTPIAQRTTFLIGKDGTIKKIFRNVDVSVHGEEVVQALQAGLGG